MTLKRLFASGTMIVAAMACTPLAAAATELHFVYVDSAGDTASFDLPSSPTPFSTSSSSIETSADFNVSNYTGTGALASGTGINLSFVSYSEYFSTVSFYLFGVIDGTTGIGGATLNHAIYTGSLDMPTFAPMPTTMIASGNTLTITDAVPEPAAWALMLVGFGGLGASLRTGRRGTAAAIG